MNRAAARPGTGGVGGRVLRAKMTRPGSTHSVASRDTADNNAS